MGIDMQIECAIRMILAGLCGGVIGLERENRQKPAGLRTHMIVGMTSAMMIIISKYGFYDVLGNTEFIRLDPSRIAAGVVTAIGFLGSGVIFTRNKTISGITTSAGIWATVGVGLSIGAGEFVLGIIATIIVLCVEIFFGRGFHFISTHTSLNRLMVEIDGGQKEVEELKSRIEEMGIKIKQFEFLKKEPNLIQVNIYIRIPKRKSTTDILQIEDKWIRSIELRKFQR